MSKATKTIISAVEVLTTRIVVAFGIDVLLEDHWRKRNLTIGARKIKIVHKLQATWHHTNTVPRNTVRLQAKVPLCYNLFLPKSIEIQDSVCLQLLYTVNGPTAGRIPYAPSWVNIKGTHTVSSDFFCNVVSAVAAVFTTVVVFTNSTGSCDECTNLGSYLRWLASNFTGTVG